MYSVYESKKLFVNKMDVSFPTQLYIDGEFVNATSGKKLRSIDPKDESIICEVESASQEDVDRACKAAHRAFTVIIIYIYHYIYHVRKGTPLSAKEGHCILILVLVAPPKH